MLPAQLFGGKFFYVCEASGESEFSYRAKPHACQVQSNGEWRSCVTKRRVWPQSDQCDAVTVISVDCHG